MKRNRQPLIIGMGAIKAPITMKALEREAGFLSSFDGNDDDFVDYAGNPMNEFLAYNGEGDDLVDFAGNKVAFTPQEQMEYERIYKFTVVNGNGTNERFKLASGLGATTGLPLADGAFNSIGGNALSIAGSPTPWERFLNFYKNNPTQVKGFFLESDVEAQISTTVEIERHSAFRASLQSRAITISNYTNENTFQTKKVTVKEEILFDHQQEIIMTIIANSTMTVTLYCGAVLNNAKALAKKIMKAENFSGKRNAYRNLAASGNGLSPGRPGGLITV